MLDIPCKVFMVFSLFIVLSCDSYDCQKKGWDGTYEDCYDDFDLNYFPFYGEWVAFDVIPGASDSDYASIEFRADETFRLLIRIDCSNNSQLSICEEESLTTEYWVLELEGEFRFSNSLKVFNGTGKICPYRYREHYGELQLIVSNSNQDEFKDRTLMNFFDVRCPGERLVFQVTTGNETLIQALFRT